MALSPEIAFDATEQNSSPRPFRVYRIDFENKRVTSEIIEGREAVKQHIHVLLRTPRFSSPIYSTDTGSELAELLSDTTFTTAYKIMEVPRLITEALIFDDLIEKVSEFNVEHIEDALHIEFVVETTVSALPLQIKEVFKNV